MDTDHNLSDEQIALQKAISIVGSATALAGHLGITKSAVSQWKEPGRNVPAEYCPSIERLTGGQVKCEELRPDVDWQYVRNAKSAPTSKRKGRTGTERRGEERRVKDRRKN